MFPRNTIFAVCSLLFALCTAPAARAAMGPIGGPGPAILGGGGNLTSFSGNTGAMNNNYWNQMMNPQRSADGGLPAADFGNCNAIIIRCAQPKCPGGGCIDMSIAMPIVNGCVQSNEACKQYGDELTQYISAQLVANSTARAMEAQAAAETAAAQAAALSTQNSTAAEMQVAMMQDQMQQMQAQMAASQAAQQQQFQEALAAQAAAQAAAAAAQPAPTASAVIPPEVLQSAAERGVSADIIARNQASGQILAQLENVSAAMQNVRKAMQDAFAYAGCDSRGENCTGPKRVTAFKHKAAAFFDPFETVQQEVYNALIQAQALGVDISDIYMMLSSSCNVWGQYLCEGDQVLRYSSSYGPTCENYRRAGEKCPPYPEMAGKIIPVGMGGCQLLKTMTIGEQVHQEWLDIREDAQANRSVRVACASDALSTSGFFKNLNMRVDEVGINDLAMVLSADVIMPTGRAPNPAEMAVCRGGYPRSTELANSAKLSEILMSNRISNVALPQGEQPDVIPGTVRESERNCLNNCHGATNYLQQGFNSETECITACNKEYEGRNRNEVLNNEKIQQEIKQDIDNRIADCYKLYGSPGFQECKQKAEFGF